MATLFEDRDAPSDVTTPYRMSVGDEFFGINLARQSDWVAVTLRAGVQYNFGAVGIGAANSGLTDPLIKVFNANGTLIASDDDGGAGLTASLLFRPASTGTYYVEVRALTSGGDGIYGLAVTQGNLPSYGAEMAAAVLYRDGYSWADTPDTPVNLTWGVRASGPAEDANGRPTALVPLTLGQINATKAALANFSDVAGITFTQVNPGGTTNAATVLVGAYDSATDGAGAYALFPGSRAANDSAGDLWINNDSVTQGAARLGSYDYWVFLHELGHAMGLSHPGDYNAAPGVTITYRNSAQFVQDSSQYSLMSYFNATDTEPRGPKNYADTLMLYDIYALQNLYGINSGTRAGDDTYGFNATVGGAYDFTVNRDPLLCIWDGAGRDTLDLSGFAGKQTIDLSAGSLSDVGGFKGNLSIAVGCEIENAIGGRGNDTIYGNGLNNVLKGGVGLDVFVATAGNDTMTGGAGADGFIFLAGDGRDRVNDFAKALDVLSFESSLWGGATLTEAQVVDQFGFVRGGKVVFDFGLDELTLQNVSSLDGLADRIVLA